jgi:hypothetical protein
MKITIELSPIATNTYLQALKLNGKDQYSFKLINMDKITGNSWGVVWVV